MKEPPPSSPAAAADESLGRGKMGGRSMDGGLVGGHGSVVGRRLPPEMETTRSERANERYFGVDLRRGRVFTTRFDQGLND